MPAETTPNLPPGTTDLTPVESGANAPTATTVSFTVACGEAGSGRLLSDYQVHAVADTAPVEYPARPDRLVTELAPQLLYDVRNPVRVAPARPAPEPAD